MLKFCNLLIWKDLNIKKYLSLQNQIGIMKRINDSNFNCVEMINVTGNYILEGKLRLGSLFVKSNLILVFVLLCNSFVFAQVPTVSYSGVQSSYTINSPMSLTPTTTNGPIVRTTVSTIAGSGTSGYVDGTTASPKFYSPAGVAIAASGNIYIADSQTHCIRKITPSWYV